jgi:hypothetical protein
MLATTLEGLMRSLLATLACSLLGFGAAIADGLGSATIEDVLDQMQDNQTLIAEILAELKTQNLQAEKVGCVAFRLSGQWRNLGGSRAVPYECQVGKRKLNIEGTVHVYDGNGTELDRKDEKSFERGTEIKQTDITWKWQ